MANTLRFKRGLASGIPTALAGEPLFTTDTFDLYIGNGTTNTRFQKYIASGATTQILRGDGSLYTFPLAISSPTTGQVLKYNGTNWVNDSDAGITGSLTTNYLPKATGATTLGNSILQEGTNAIGLGAAPAAWGSPFIAFQVNSGGVALSGRSDGQQLNLSTNWRFAGSTNLYIANGYATRYVQESGIHVFNYASSGTAGAALTWLEAGRFTALGNLHIGTFSSDSGEKLQVTGTMKVTGQSVLATTSGATSVGIGVTSPTYKLDIEGGADYQQLRIKHSSHVLALLESTTAGRQSLISFKSPTRQYALGLQTDGTFSLYDNTAAATRVLVDTSGNLGLAVTPSGWAGGFNAMQYLGGAVWSGTGYQGLNQNAFYNGTSWIYRSTGVATNYEQNAGQHRWYNAISGSANAAITFTQAMTLDASGRLGIGTTNPLYKLDVKGGNASTLRLDNDGSQYVQLLFERNTTANSGGDILLDGTNGTLGIRTLATYALTFSTAASAGTSQERMRIFSATGNLSIGSTSDTGEKLQVTGTAKITGNTTIGSTAFSVDTANTRVGIGTNVPSWALDIVTTGTSISRIRGGASNNQGAAYFVTQGGSNTTLLAIGDGSTMVGGAVNNAMIYVNASPLTFNMGGTNRMSLETNGNFIVDGTVFFVDAVNNRVGMGITTPTEMLHVSGNGIITGNLAVDTNTLFVDATNNRVGIGTASPAATFSVDTSASQFVWLNSTNVNGGYITGYSSSTAVWDIGTAKQALNVGSATDFGINVRSGFLSLGTGNTERMRLDSTGLKVNDAIAIGTTPDTSNPFKILKNINATVGIKFENTNTSSLAFSAVQLGTDVSGGTKFTNLVYASSGVTASGVYNPDGTSLINNGNGGLNFLGNPIRMYTGGSNGVLRWDISNEGIIQYNATSPTTSATDAYKQYSADVTAGNAAPHFRTENGAVIKLYQETTAVGNSIFAQGGGNSVLDDSTFDGYTLRQIVKALRNQGILA